VNPSALARIRQTLQRNGMLTSIYSRSNGFSNGGGRGGYGGGSGGGFGDGGFGGDRMNNLGAGLKQQDWGMSENRVF
jgi:hypothetical protein